MRRNDVAASLILIAGALLAIFLVIPSQVRSGSGPAQGLEAGLMPTIAAGSILLLAIVLLLQSLLASRRESLQQIPKIETRAPIFTWRGVAAIVCMIVSALLMEFAAAWAGFAFAILAPMFLLGERRPLRLIAVPTTTIAVIYVLVEHGIKVTLP